MSRIFERLCEKRGVGEDFLLPKYESLVDPFWLPDMERAVERILEAARKGEKVLIYGDYDVDGVTATTLMYDTLRLVGVKDIELMLPDRFQDGYGMSERAVRRALDGGVGLVVTVDCGSGNKRVVDELLASGVGVVVTDHHECMGELPDCPVVNPKRREFLESEKFEEARKVGLLDLAGVGVAFELARALMLKGAIPEGQEKWLLDLVAIGTLCDSMRLTAQNRILTYWGMRVLAKTRRLGLKELIRLARVTELNTEAIGFRIGPRLNAAGRLRSAELALKLLMTRNGSEAARLAAELEELNKERQETQQKATEEIRQAGVGEEPVIVAVGEWHEGVLGIIAGKLVEEYKRPAFVLAKVGDEYKGSGRSFGDFSLAEALKACAGSIVGGGGHREACGVRLVEPEDFRRELNAYYRSLNLVDQERYLLEEADLEIGGLKEVTTELVGELAGLEPYGEGNREPVFLVRARVLELHRMGAEKQHLSLLLKSEDGGALRMVAFSAPKDWMSLVVGEPVKVWVRLMENEFRGLKSVEARLLDLERLED